MGNFSNNAITDGGKMLHADVQAGAVFTPTRIVMGSGMMPSGATTQSMTDVITPVKSMSINKKTRTPDGKCIFGGVYTNEEVTAPFYFRELALYAKAVYLNADGTVKSEGEETLYSYGNAGETADYMPAYSTSTVVEKQMDLVTWVGNTAQVDLTIESGIYVYRKDFEKHSARHAIGGEDPITPADIGAAPAGYVTKTYIATSDEEIDAAMLDAYALTGNTSVGYFTIAVNREDLMIPGGSWHITVYRSNERYGSFELISYETNTVRKATRGLYGGSLHLIAWDNPPLVSGKEYRTIERYKGVPVHKKLDSAGNILWRAEHENQWHLLFSASYVSPATIE